MRIDFGRCWSNSEAKCCVNTVSKLEKKKCEQGDFRSGRLTLPLAGGLSWERCLFCFLGYVRGLTLVIRVILHVGCYCAVVWHKEGVMRGLTPLHMRYNVLLLLHVIVVKQCVLLKRTREDGDFESAVIWTHTTLIQLILSDHYKIVPGGAASSPTSRCVWSLKCRDAYAGPRFQTLSDPRQAIRWTLYRMQRRSALGSDADTLRLHYPALLSAELSPNWVSIEPFAGHRASRSRTEVMGFCRFSVA